MLNIGTYCITGIETGLRTEKRCAPPFYFLNFKKGQQLWRSIKPVLILKTLNMDANIHSVTVSSVVVLLNWEKLQHFRGFFPKLNFVADSLYVTLGQEHRSYDGWEGARSVLFYVFFSSCFYVTGDITDQRHATLHYWYFLYSVAIARCYIQ